MILWTLALGAVVTRLAPARHAARATCIRASASEIEISVERTPAGALGISVDEENVVATVADDQPALRLGDKILAVAGERLDGRPLAQVLQPAESYTFTVLRGAADGAASLERVLARLLAESESARDSLTPGEAAATAPGDFEAAQLRARLGMDVDEAEAAPAELPEAAPALIDSLEEAGAPADAASTLLGFWKLCWPPPAEADLTGYGAAPFCSVVASWTRFAEKDPTAQVVEIVANENLNAHTLAALKGEWSVAAADGSTRLVQDFSRREYGGQPTVEPMLCESVLSFVGESLLLVRAGDDAEELRIFERCDGGAVQAEIGRLLEAPVKGEKLTRWELADKMRGRGGEGGPEVQTAIP